MTALITGGAGYIGSHIVAALVAAGTDVVVVDDLSTGFQERVPDVPVWRFDLADAGAVARVRDVMVTHSVTEVVHVAAKKQVAESVARPAWYYQQNVTGLTAVLLAMEACSVSRLVFSSSATVYGCGTDVPLVEDAPTKPINPYGRTKLVGEWLIADAVAAGWLTATSLRYFNVAGAGSDKLADRAALNLIPMVFERIVRGEAPRVFGDDYPTPDGTCIRDYVHVVDLADAHLLALAALRGRSVPPALNVGTGRGYSVREVIDAVARVTGTDLGVEIGERRPGDSARLVSDVHSIERELGWVARLGLNDMVESAWNGFSRLETGGSFPGPAR